MNKLLLNEAPLIILPTLACAIGLNEAIFIQQLYYWLEKSSVYFDNKKWVYKSLKEWENEFPFWSKSTIKRGYILLKKFGNFNYKKDFIQIPFLLNKIRKYRGSK